MAEIKKIATRDSYGNALKELGAEFENLVVLDADLAGATKTATFLKAFPERHFDAGIAEANMVCMAAGMATAGLVPFASSFAMFAAGRAFEQIRNSVGYPHLNVKIGATHGGISVGEDGASHQCCEDFGLMRTIPGMVVMSPADDVEAKAMVRAAYLHEGPVYMRFGRAAVPVIHGDDFKFEIGKGETLRDGKDVAIIANGLMVAEALTAAEELAAAKKCGKIITCEEHSIIGGLGEAVSSFLAENHPTLVKRIGVNDEFGHSGPATDLLKQFGLSCENIVATAKELCK